MSENVDSERSAASPFVRAAVGLRAFALVLMWPALWCTWIIIDEVTRFRVRDLPFVMLFVCFCVGPTSAFWFAAWGVRRGEKWAVTFGRVLLVFGSVALLFSLIGLSTGLVVEYRRPPPYTYQNLIKYSVMCVALVILQAAIVACFRHIGQAEEARRATNGPRGFELEFPVR